MSNRFGFIRSGFGACQREKGSFRPQLHALEERLVPAALSLAFELAPANAFAHAKVPLYTYLPFGGAPSTAFDATRKWVADASVTQAVDNLQITALNLVSDTETDKKPADMPGYFPDQWSNPGFAGSFTALVQTVPDYPFTASTAPSLLAALVAGKADWASDFPGGISVDSEFDTQDLATGIPDFCKQFLLDTRLAANSAGVPFSFYLSPKYIDPARNPGAAQVRADIAAVLGTDVRNCVLLPVYVDPDNDPGTNIKPAQVVSAIAGIDELANPFNYRWIVSIQDDTVTFGKALDSIRAAVPAADTHFLGLVAYQTLVQHGDPTTPQAYNPTVAPASDNLAAIAKFMGLGNSITTDTTPTFNGTGPENQTVGIEVDGLSRVEVRVNAQGNWSYTLPHDLALGSHHAVVTMRNLANEQFGEVGPLSFSIVRYLVVPPPTVPTIALELAPVSVPADPRIPVFVDMAQSKDWMQFFPFYTGLYAMTGPLQPELPQWMAAEGVQAVVNEAIIPAAIVGVPGKARVTRLPEGAPGFNTSSAIWPATPRPASFAALVEVAQEAIYGPNHDNYLRPQDALDLQNLLTAGAWLDQFHGGLTIRTGSMGYLGKTFPDYYKEFLISMRQFANSAPGGGVPFRFNIDYEILFDSDFYTVLPDIHAILGDDPRNELLLPMQRDTTSGMLPEYLFTRIIQDLRQADLNGYGCNYRCITGMVTAYSEPPGHEPINPGDPELFMAQLSMIRACISASDQRFLGLLAYPVAALGDGSSLQIYNPTQDNIKTNLKAIKSFVGLGNGITRDTTPMINGTGGPGETITLREDGLVLGTTLVNDRGNWIFNALAHPLSQGMHSLIPTATSETGVESAPGQPLVFTIDSALPPPDGPMITEPFTLGAASVTTGWGDGQLLVGLADGRTRQIVPFPGYTGQLVGSLLDRNLDGAPDAVAMAVASAGAPPSVLVVDAVTGRQVLSLYAFNSRFLGGMSLASGLVMIGGVPTPTLALGAGPGGDSTVALFNAMNGVLLLEYTPYDRGYVGGVSVALSSPDSAGISYLITEANNGHVVVTRADQPRFGVLASFLAFEPLTGSLLPGSRIACGDLDGDGAFEVVASAPGGQSNRIAFFTLLGQQQKNLYPFSALYLGGLDLALADWNGDGKTDLVATSLAPSRITRNVFNYPAVDLIDALFVEA